MYAELRLVVFVALAGCTSATEPQATTDKNPSANSEDTAAMDTDRPPVVGVDAVRLPSRCADGVRFCDHTDGSGLDDVGYAFGRGAAWVDLDNDGWDDLWRCDGGDGYEGWRRTAGAFHNQGDGTFKRWDLGLPPDATNHCWGAAWADIDNDGDLDVFFANGGFEAAVPARMFRNDLHTTGGFTDISEFASLDPDPHRWWAASFGDYDNDGLVDLFADALSGTDDMITDGKLEHGRVALYHNLGNGNFEEKTEILGFPAGMNDKTGSAKTVVWWDYDLDGDLDLFMAIDASFGVESAQNWLLRNDGGSFVDVTAQVLVEPWVTGPVFAAAVEDFDQDGHDDLYLGTMESQDAILYTRGGGELEIVGPENGMLKSTDPAVVENTMGLSVGDIDGDGWPEIFVGTGRPDAAGLPLVFCHDGPSLQFHRCSDDLIAGHGMARHHGMAIGDWDHDGDSDVYLNLGGLGICMLKCTFDLEQRSIPRLYVNEVGAREHTATVHLIGVTSNRDAIGARIAVTGSRTHHYGIRSMQGFGSQHSRWVLVTLGTSDSGEVEINWPSGQVTRAVVHTGDRLELAENGASALWPERVRGL